MTGLSPDEAFELELIKLLARMAVTDHDTAPVEIAVIRQIGADHGVSDRALDAVQTLLEGGAGLPRPDIETLRAHPDRVMKAARALVASDGVLEDEEMEALEQLEASLKA